MEMKIIKRDSMDMPVSGDGYADSGEMRAYVVKCRNDFKSSWRNLAQALYTVWKDKHYKEWGYQTFDHYTAKEVFVRKHTAMKLIRSYRFLEEEEPQYLKDDSSRGSETGTMPSFEDVEVLRKAKKNLDESGYRDVKKDILEKGRDTQAVKKDLTAMIRQRKELDTDDMEKRQNAVTVKRFVATLRSLRREIEVLKLLPGFLVSDIDSLIGKIEQEIARQ